MPRRKLDEFYVFDLGEEIYPGFHVGDEIYLEDWGNGWVSNIQTRGEGDYFFVITDEDPNKLLLQDPDTLCHGNWVGSHNIDDMTVVDCPHCQVTDEEIAEVFGLTLLEMIPNDDPTK